MTDDITFLRAVLTAIPAVPETAAPMEELCNDLHDVIRAAMQRDDETGFFVAIAALARVVGRLINLSQQPDAMAAAFVEALATARAAIEAEGLDSSEPPPAKH